MTICYPQIITSRLCPRDELEFSNTPPTCVRVVPIYNDAIYVVGQFPPPVHFLITDSGQVYQLADITSPPSTPPEYHALLDSSGCILVGVELSSITNAPITNSQIRVLPGVLRYILTTLGLGIGDVTSQLPVQRCRRQLWQEIVDETVDCLNQPPPPPPTPPSLTCGFVLSCLSNGQNIAISGGGTISAGQLVPGPNAGEYTWLNPLGVPQYTFSLASGLSVLDTTTIDLTLAPGPVLSANVIVSPATGNQLQILPTGLYVPPAAFNVLDTQSVDLTYSGGTLSADVIVSPAPNNQLVSTPQGLFVPPSTTLPCFPGLSNAVVPLTNSYFTLYNVNTGCLDQLAVPAQTIPYGDWFGSGIPRFDNLLYDSQNNYFRHGQGGLSVPGIHSKLTLAGNNTSIFGLIFTDGILSSTSVNQTIGSYINSNGNSITSLNYSSFFAEEVGINSAFFSSVHAFNSTINDVNRSFVTVNNANVGSVTNSVALINSVRFLLGSYSFVAADGPFLALQPQAVYSLYLGKDSVDTGLSVAQFAVFLSDNTSLSQYDILYSSCITDRTTFVNTGYTRYSALFSELATVGNIEGTFASLRSTGNQTVNALRSFISQQDTVPPSNRVAPTTPFINSSVLSYVGRLPNASNSILISLSQLPLSSISRSVLVAQPAIFIDPNPPLNSILVEDSLIVGTQVRVDATVNVNSLLMVGDNLAAGPQSRVILGRGTVTNPAIQNAGGYFLAINDGGGTNFIEAWRDHVFRFRPFPTNFANDATAASILNTTYGSDPRIIFGSLVVANVNGTPAIFAWNGTTFVRITV
jgi:hypothetical protein